MPDSKQLQGIVRKAVAAITGFLLALVLLIALLVTGFYLLIQALILALSPWVGQAGAMGLAGLLCVLLLVAFFQRMMRPASAERKGEAARSNLSPVHALRKIIMENPLEATLMAFAAGVVEQGDPRLKELLFQGGMTLMKQTDFSGEPGKTSPDPASEHTPPEEAE